MSAHCRVSDQLKTPPPLCGCGRTPELRAPAAGRCPPRIVGVLHDLLEDTPHTAEGLRERGYGEEILQALNAVTRRAGESYEESILRSKSNPIARRVKLADLEDNMDLRRVPEVTARDLERLARYRRAWAVLQ